MSPQVDELDITPSNSQLVQSIIPLQGSVAAQKNGVKSE